MEAVTDLDRLIERRAEKNGEARSEEEAWKESVRRYNNAREVERRAAWCQYHRGQAKRLKRIMTNLVEFHEAKARDLLEEGTQQ